MKSLSLPIMFLGPASYNVAPCELMFAQIKSVLLNPQYLPTGKQGIKNIVNFILSRIDSIPPSTRILPWHHCL